MKRALLLVLNSFTHDPRVLRQAQTLACDGWDVLLFALHEPDLPLQEDSRWFRLRRFRLRTRFLPKNKPVQLLKYAECLVQMTWDGVQFKPQIVHANDVDCLPIGFAVARLSRAKLVYDAHELWSDPIAARHVPRWFSRLGAWVEKVLARRADSVITVCDSIAQHMSEKMSIPVPIVVRNVPWKSRARHFLHAPGPLYKLLGLNVDVPVILQLGMIGVGRGIETLIAAMQFVKPPATAVIMGADDSTYAAGKEPTYLQHVQELARSFGLEGRVYFLPPVPAEQIPSYAADAAVGVALIEGTCLSYQYALPNKLFEYIQAGLPVVTSDLPEMAALVKRYGLGQTFPAGNPELLARTLNDVLHDPKKLRGYREHAFIAAKELNWNSEQMRLLQLYRELEVADGRTPSKLASAPIVPAHSFHELD